MDNKIDCICEVLEEIRGFNSLSEFDRFLKYIKGLLKENYLTQVTVTQKYANSQIFKEQWYECTGCKQIWRLVTPDFPFKGLWERIQ